MPILAAKKALAFGLCAHLTLQRAVLVRRDLCSNQRTAKFTGTLRFTKCLRRSSISRRPKMAGDAALFEYALRFGDNTLILGQRLAAWCGHGPALEEDIALTNVALDLLGQSRFWLTYAGQIESKGRSEDSLAFLRDAGEFRNVLLVEQENGSFADTMARQFFFDTWHYFLLQALLRSSDRRVAEIAEKSLKEVTYHLQRSTDWLVRLGDGTEESHSRMQAALDDIWNFTGELFEMDTVDTAVLDQGIGCDLRLLREPWQDHVDRSLAKATLAQPSPGFMHTGGKRGVHSETFGLILAEMQFLQRAHPGAQW